MDERILAVGELLWDLLPDGKALGGAPANFANRTRLLGARAKIVSRVGSDVLGDELVGGILALGLSTELIQRDSLYPTGTVPVTLGADGNPKFEILPNVAYDHLELTGELMKAAKESDLIYFGTLVQRTSGTRDTLYRLLDENSHVTKFLDINLRTDCYTPETVIASLNRANIIKLNQTEVQRVSGILDYSDTTIEEFARNTLEQFDLEACLITLGSDGVFALSRAEGGVRIPGFSVSVTDTVGAGDAFAAGFIVNFLRGCDIQRCCKIGNALGALSAASRGGMGEISLSQIEEMVGEVRTPRSVVSINR